ncbi:DUF1638 domain-containing protein [Planctomycetota bacterium]
MKRYRLIACNILYRECCHCAARSRNVVDITWCEKGLHDIGAEKMSARLQTEIDAVDRERYDAVLLGYGLCNNGTIGLHADIPIVMPRAHDCIALLMGSKEKYREYFDAHPGTYYKSCGWIEHDDSCVDNPDSTVSQLGFGTYRQYVEKYGEENAQYLMETLGSMQHYDRLAFIDTHVGDFQHYKDDVRREAAEKGWKYDEIDGNTDLPMRMMNGEWNQDEFLVIEPGRVSSPSYDESVVTLKACM